MTIRVAHRPLSFVQSRVGFADDGINDVLLRDVAPGVIDERANVERVKTVNVATLHVSTRDE